MHVRGNPHAVIFFYRKGNRDIFWEYCRKTAWSHFLSAVFINARSGNTQIHTHTHAHIHTHAPTTPHSHTNTATPTHTCTSTHNPPHPHPHAHTATHSLYFLYG